jgi:hypothetical protein
VGAADCHRPDRQTDWFVLSPVQAQFDLRAFRSGLDIKACEGCTPQVGLDLESFTQVCRDNDVHCLREVEIGAGFSEKADIGGPAVQEAVGLNRVPARQREAERPGGIQRDAGELLVKWIHAED